jgi:hypothetical protein
VLQPRIFDLDGSLLRQPFLLRRVAEPPLDLRAWAPWIRLGCRQSTFGAFEAGLRELTRSASDARPFVTFYGSGDFHHVTLALLRRLRTPCNLLVLDKHPDWMRGVPFLHCGTWLYHAAALPHVGRVFHVGGELDFDNRFRWLAPWRLLRASKITVLPAVRHFRGRRWREIAHQPLRLHPDVPANVDRIAQCLGPFQDDLASHPLYVSLDKDVLTADEALVNWDSGYLGASEAIEVVRAFVAAARGELAGMDVVGDWSPVRVRGLFRRALHWTEHPTLYVNPAEAAARNEQVNLAVLQAVASRRTLRLRAA